MTSEVISWKLRRVNGDGSEDQTLEMTDEGEARALYANWAENMRRFNDVQVSITKVVKTFKVECIATNLDYRKPVPA